MSPIRTSAGRDWQAAVLGNGAAVGAGTGAMRPADYMAVSANAAAPVDTDTTLAGEIATAGGALVRKQAAWGHVAGAATYTLTVTYTANAIDVLPVTLAKGAVFNAASGGVMAFESLILPTLPMQSPGDQATLTEQITI